MKKLKTKITDFIFNNILIITIFLIEIIGISIIILIILNITDPSENIIISQKEIIELHKEKDNLQIEIIKNLKEIIKNK